MTRAKPTEHTTQIARTTSSTTSTTSTALVPLDEGAFQEWEKKDAERLYALESLEDAAHVIPDVMGHWLYHGDRDEAKRVFALARAKWTMRRRQEQYTGVPDLPADPQKACAWLVDIQHRMEGGLSLLEAAKAVQAEREVKAGRPSTPQGKIPASQVIREYHVSKRTLLRHHSQRGLKSYRPDGGPDNAEHIFSRADIEQRWSKRTMPLP